MDEATIQKRIEQLNASPNMVAFYRAAYADGLEAAAKIAGSPLGPALCDFDDHWGPRIAKQIRQHAKEMGHES